MDFVNMRSKVAHHPECHFISRIADANLGCYENTSYTRKDGYRRCKCCDPMARRLSNRDTEMLDYCQEKEFHYEADQGELRITTPFSQWKAYPGEGRQYVLYHKNTLGNINCYHFQTGRLDDVMDMLEYIDRHDQYRMANPLTERKKNSSSKKYVKRYRTEEHWNKEQKCLRREMREALELQELMMLS